MNQYKLNNWITFLSSLSLIHLASYCTMLSPALSLSLYKDSYSKHALGEKMVIYSELNIPYYLLVWHFFI